MMMVVMMTMLWCRKLEVILRIEGRDFDEVYDKIEDEGEAVVEEESITTLLHSTRSGRIFRTWKGRASALDFS